MFTKSEKRKQKIDQKSILKHDLQSWSFLFVCYTVQAGFFLLFFFFFAPCTEDANVRSAKVHHVQRTVEKLRMKSMTLR